MLIAVELTLEELDRVFSVSTRHHAMYQLKNTIWHFRTWVLRQKLEPMPKLYETFDRPTSEMKTESKVRTENVENTPEMATEPKRENGAATA
jgi:hypothetical protein